MPIFNAFSVEVLKASLLASSLRCPGFSTLVLNLCLPDLPDPNHGYMVLPAQGAAQHEHACSAPLVAAKRVAYLRCHSGGLAVHLLVASSFTLNLESHLKCGYVRNFGLPLFAAPPPFKKVNRFIYAPFCLSTSVLTRRSAQAGLSEGEACGPWLKEYQRGSTYEPYGFLPGPELIGLPFSRAAGAVAERGLLLVGAQVDGQIRLNPSAEVRPGSDELASKVSVFPLPLF